MICVRQAAAAQQQGLGGGSAKGES